MPFFVFLTLCILAIMAMAEKDTAAKVKNNSDKVTKPKKDQADGEMENSITDLRIGLEEGLKYFLIQYIGHFYVLYTLFSASMRKYHRHSSIDSPAWTQDNTKASKIANERTKRNSARKKISPKVLVQSIARIGIPLMTVTFFSIYLGVAIILNMDD